MGARTDRTIAFHKCNPRPGERALRSLHTGDPERIGAYRLLGRLGEGGMGRVYLAQSPRGRTVAVKLVRHELAEHPEFRRRFEQEVGAARRVGGEWTAPVLDADTEAEQPWVATGYIPGISLHEAVAGRAGGRAALPERTLRILANRLALALGAVHEAGLIHRDVKPSNILVTIDGPRVIDFGIARALETVAEAHLTRTGAVVGSPGFMSPEQVRGERLTPASDIFSLGSVLGFAATGRTPFGGASNAGHVLMYRITQEEPDLEGVPEGLRELVAACLDKVAEERPTVDQLLERTADPEDEPGPTSTGTELGDPWLPAALVAHLGRHAARLLDAEVPGAQEAADRAAEAPAIPPPPSTPPRPALPPAPSGPPVPATPPGAAKEAADTPPPTPTPTPTTTPAQEPDQGPAPAPPVVPPPAAVHGMATITGGAVQGAPQGPQGPHTPHPPHPPHGTQVAPAPYPAAPESGGGRRGRRATVLVAAGVALALVTGVGTYVALRVLDAPDGGEKGGAEAGRSPGDGSEADGKPDASARPGDEDGGLSPAPEGTLPKKYLGAWQGTVQDNGESVTRRFEIRQGDKGEVVAKTVNLRKDLMCVGEATLISFEGRMKVTSRITQAYPTDKSCSPYGEQELRLSGDDRMEWTYPHGSLTAGLKRTSGAVSGPVPRGALGTWKGYTDAEKKHARTLTFAQGPAGEAVMKNVGESEDYHCEWTSVLGAADGDTLMYGPSDTDEAASEGKCDLEARSIEVALVGDELRIHNPEKPNDTPRVYRRSG